ncbi:unnamed protein product [Prunus armeniaca]
MRKILELSKPTYDWLAEKDPRHWNRAHFKSDSKFDMLMNNLCETFTHSIMDTRDKPVLTKLERISWFHGNPEDFYDAVYKKEAYLRAYEPMIMPMTRQDQWMKTNLPQLLSPKYHKQPGMAFLYVEIVVEKAIIELVEPRNPNIEPTKKRKVAKEKLPVRRRDGKEQSTRQQSIQLRQRKQASGSQGWVPKVLLNPRLLNPNHLKQLKLLNPNHLKQLRLLNPNHLK